jgi:hypothetical protein
MLGFYEQDKALKTNKWLPFGDDYSGEYFAFDLNAPAGGGEYKILSLLRHAEYVIDFDCADFPDFIHKSMIDMGDWA